MTTLEIFGCCLGVTVIAGVVRWASRSDPIETHESESSEDLDASLRAASEAQNHRLVDPAETLQVTAHTTKNRLPSTASSTTHRVPETRRSF